MKKILLLALITSALLRRSPFNRIIFFALLLTGQLETLNCSAQYSFEKYYGPMGVSRGLYVSETYDGDFLVCGNSGDLSLDSVVYPYGYNLRYFMMEITPQ